MSNRSVEELDLQILDECQNYNKWIYALVKNDLSEDILEVGCGIGRITEFLLENNRKVLSIDINNSHLKYIKNKFKDTDNFKSEFNDISSNNKPIDRSFMTITCFNVLHHIKKQDSALKNMCKLLDDDGKLIVLEPALPYLYGSIDKEEYHARRYSKKGIKSVLTKNGFKVGICRYINLVGAIGWFVSGKIFRRKALNKKQAMLFDKVWPLIGSIEKKMVVPFGLSLLCICEKK